MNFWRLFNRIKITHQAYGGYFLSIPGFLSIIYTNLVTPVPWLMKYLPTFLHFALAFASIYIPILYLMSLIHYGKKGPNMEQQRLNNETNPYVIASTHAWLSYFNGDIDKAKQYLEEQSFV